MRSLSHFCVEKIRNICEGVAEYETVHETELDNTGRTIRVYNVKNEYYLSKHDTCVLVSHLLQIQNNMDVREYVEQTMRAYVINTDEVNHIEVCKVDHLDEHAIQQFIDRFRNDQESEDDRLFKSIIISDDESIESRRKHATLNTNINDIMSNIDTLNSFIDSSDTPFVPIQKRKPLSSRNATWNKGVDLKDRPFVCQHVDCKRAFKRYEHLKRHNKMHTGERPYKCVYPGCMKAFARSDNLSQHFKTHNVPSHRKPSFKNFYEL